MPIYEFRCAKCEHVQEVIVSSSDSENVEMKCNSCDGEVLERVLSTVSYAMGRSKGAPAPNKSIKSCGENTCGTINIPGPTR